MVNSRWEKKVNKVNAPDPPSSFNPLFFSVSIPFCGLNNNNNNNSTLVRYKHKKWLDRLSVETGKFFFLEDLSELSIICLVLGVIVHHHWFLYVILFLKYEKNAPLRLLVYENKQVGKKKNDSNIELTFELVSLSLSRMVQWRLPVVSTRNCVLYTRGNNNNMFYNYTDIKKTL